MIVDLKFSRFESAPWGFRLVGGSDFDIPLTVIKVTEGSLAEKAGLRVGDVIVRINDEATSRMTHNDAHDVIMHAGNNFFFGVMRRQDDEQDQDCNEIQQNQQESVEKELSHAPDSSDKSPVPDITDQLSQQNQIPQSVQSDDQHNAADEEIAELMSDQTENPPEHDIVGVFPKPGICMSSEVLQTLNEESVTTEKDLEKEKRKWTTFLQKPNRPIPKTKQELEEEAKRVPYVVKIVKQPKPRVAPDRPPSPPPPPVIEPEPEPEPEIHEEETLGPEPSDSEIPNLEEITSNEEVKSETVQEVHQISETVTEQHVQEIQTVVESSERAERKIEVIQKTAEELALEKQLADVQKQLLALSTLPSTIQATLDAVTKQLSDLLPTFRLQPSPIPQDNKKIDEDAARRDRETAEMMKICQDRITKLSEQKILEIPSMPPRISVEQIDQKRKEEHQELQLQDELTYKKQKEQNLITELEHKQRLIRERTPRKSKKLFGPLTPQERPLILPGGRKWRKPKDAYNDEFIAEVLTSQAELITGTTLGRTSESSNLGHDERHYNFIALTEEPKQRVNFLKYQKPEKKIDLQKSEVYKVIHHLEREPIRGIEVRPPKVLAEEDVRRCATPSPTPKPISCT